MIRLMLYTQYTGDCYKWSGHKVSEGAQFLAQARPDPVVCHWYACRGYLLNLVLMIG